MEENNTEKRRAASFVRRLVSTAVAAGVVIAVALFLSDLLFPTGSLISIVDGDSMLPTLTDGQILYADVTPIQRGDIVIAQLPGEDSESALIVKRVIALPGDTLTINEEGVYVNSQLVEEAYLTEEAVQVTYIAAGCNYRILGPEEYYLMGDNRLISYDSRYFGPVDESSILYKQSTSPTGNTYAMLFLLICVIAVCCGLYFALESGLGRLLEKLIPDKNKS